MAAALLLTDPEPETRGFLERHLPRDGFELVPDHGRFDLVLAGHVERLERWVEPGPAPYRSPKRRVNPAWRGLVGHPGAAQRRRGSRLLPEQPGLAVALRGDVHGRLRAHFPYTPMPDGLAFRGPCAAVE